MILVQCGQEHVSGSWNSEDIMNGSFTMRKIIAVKYVLLSLVSKLAGLSLKWFTDNQNVPRILSCENRRDPYSWKLLIFYRSAVGTISRLK